MSDSVVNAGSEDVLSSVKRLVDEDVREESEFIFVPSSPQRNHGRLVLTEALRVSAESPTRGKADPLKLTPRDSISSAGPMNAANLSDLPETPMRLQPCDKVSVDDPAEPPKAPEGNRQRDLTGSLSAKIEALEAAIARTEDQWEPDGQSNDAYSGTKTRAVEWPTDAAETQAATEPKMTFIRSKRPGQDKPGSAEKAPEATVALDDDALRALVTQIVREELQGALGERITKNLRKLVRREINRAIATRDLD